MSKKFSFNNRCKVLLTKQNLFYMLLHNLNNHNYIYIYIYLIIFDHYKAVIQD